MDRRSRETRVPPLVGALAGIGAGFLGWWTLVTFFSPRLRLRMRECPPVDDPAFSNLLETACPAKRSEGNRVGVLVDGEAFYPAMLEAIRGAERSVCLECYDFLPGEMQEAFTEALADRARHGVTVSVLLDAIGSFSLYDHGTGRMREAGCRVHRYDPGTITLVGRLNNRTHREILVVDGRVAFTGGPGVADHWARATRKGPRWRDTSFRIEGPAVAHLQGTFSENWLTTAGEILAGDAFYPPLERVGATPALVVKSSPADRATPAHFLFFALLACARRSVRICTPYFVPDRTMSTVICDAARRGVDVSLLVPGDHTDQELLHVNSRRTFGRLLRSGVRIYEYTPSMIHQKLLLVDDTWAVVGTTNMDNRSFELNDEINVAFPDAALVRELTAVYARDLANANELTLDEWRQRPLLEQAFGRVGWVLDRQQ